jgi:hypothetical protein
MKGMTGEGIAENGGVSIPQSLPTASQEARRELERLQASFSSLAACPFFYKILKII